MSLLSQKKAPSNAKATAASKKLNFVLTAMLASRKPPAGTASSALLSPTTPPVSEEAPRLPEIQLIYAHQRDMNMPQFAAQGSLSGGAAETNTASLNSSSTSASSNTEEYYDTPDEDEHINETITSYVANEPWLCDLIAWSDSDSVAGSSSAAASGSGDADTLLELERGSMRSGSILATEVTRSGSIF